MAAHGRARVRGPRPGQRARPAGHDPTAPLLVAGAEVRRHEHVRQAGDRGRRRGGRRGRRHQPAARQLVGSGGARLPRRSPSPTPPTPTPSPSPTPVVVFPAGGRARDRRHSHDPGRRSVLVRRADAGLDQQRVMGHRQGRGGRIPMGPVHLLAERRPGGVYADPCAQTQSPADRSIGGRSRGRRGRRCPAPTSSAGPRTSPWGAPREARRAHRSRGHRLRPVPRFYLWYDPGARAMRALRHGPGSTIRVWIVDVDGSDRLDRWRDLQGRRPRRRSRRSRRSSTRSSSSSRSAPRWRPSWPPP